MRNLFWGNVEEIIKVSSDIPDKNLYILKKLYPNSEIIKESSYEIQNNDLTYVVQALKSSTEAVNSREILSSYTIAA